MANNQSRNYSTLTIKRLYALSGNRCAFPGCDRTFVNWEDDTNFSNICHIEDANPNTHKADRFNQNMSDKERADYKNLVLLCPNHHIETNDPSKYTVESLKTMKREHEKNIASPQVGKNIIAKYPSVLSTIINQIGSTLLKDEIEEFGKKVPDTEEKILYNNVITYKPIIEEFSIYQGKLNGIYDEIEKQGSSKKSFLLQNIKTLYLKEKGKYANIEAIRDNADLIFENIENEIWKILESSSNLSPSLPIESIKMGILIVMVDAFMRCKILEEPVKL
ncbi:MAG: HNH endonuclease [Bacteroidales bacterium]|nr:HNH endonuclease [Bacteroidales bacterium]MCF8455526.1 HNH endonuclease [Bacteroidales bacterium]